MHQEHLPGPMGSILDFLLRHLKRSNILKLLQLLPQLQFVFWVVG